MAIPQGPYYKAVGAKIRTARRAANVTQFQLANAIGMTRTSITNMERGRQPIYLHTVSKIADTLRVSVSDLLPEPATLDTNLAAKLEGIPSPQKDWIARVIAAEPEIPNATKISVRST